MDGRSNKESDPGKQPPDIPSEFNKNIPIGLLQRELGYKEKQRGVPLEFQAAAEDKLVTKDYEELRCELPGASRSTFLMVFSPDGKKVASTHGNHNVYVTDLTTGKNVNTLSGHPRTPWCIAFHPSSNQILASGCLGGQVRVWDLHGGSEVWTADGQTVIASLAFHPTDRLLVIATYNELHFWDWSQPEPFAKCYTNNEKEKVRYVAFDQLGHKLITGISNAPLVQTQWDRVTTAGPHSNVNNTPASQSSSGQNHHYWNAPERERRITICYRSLVEQYEQLVQRYFDLSRSRSIPTMDRGTDPMDLEAETSSSSTQTGLGPNRQREMGTSTGDVGSSTSGATSNTDPPFDADRMRSFLGLNFQNLSSPAAGSEADQGASSSADNSPTETTGDPAMSSEGVGEGGREGGEEETVSNEENGVADGESNSLPNTFSLNAAGTLNISRTQNNAANPGVTLNIPVVENNRLANTINMINSGVNDMHTVIIADTGRQDSPSVEAAASNTARNALSEPHVERIRLHIRTYEVRDMPVRNTPTEQNSQASPPTQQRQSQESSPPTTEGLPWQSQGCLFSRLHQQAQPTSPSTPSSERPRRFFVSQRSAFQPRTPRSDQDSESQERRYLFPRRPASSNPPAEPAERPEPERSGSISPPIPTQRPRMDMTDVGVRYGIQLLSRHIDNMQRLCRARLEILQLQQIRRMWEDLQRQIRSLHVAVRESTLALTGTSDPAATPGLQRPFQGSATSNSEQMEGVAGDGNACHIPSVSQMMESARISDGSPQQERPSDATRGPVIESVQSVPLNLVKNLLRIQHGERVMNNPPTPLRNSDDSTSNDRSLGDTNNGAEGVQSSSNPGGTTARDLISSPSAGAKKRSMGVATHISSVPNSSRNPTCTLRIFHTQHMKINLNFDSRKQRHPAGRGNSGGCQNEQGCSRSAKPGPQGNKVQNSGPVSSRPEKASGANTACATSRSQSPNKSNESSDRSSESNQNNPGTSAATGLNGIRFALDQGRPRTDFLVVSSMNNVPPSSSGTSTTSTAGSAPVTVPSSTGQASNTSLSNDRRSNQTLQQRLLRISRKVYLRRPRLLALAPRSVRRQSGIGHMNSSRSQPGLFSRHNEAGRRPWFLQSAARAQRRSTNTASQVGSISTSDSGVSTTNQTASEETNIGEAQQTDGNNSRLSSQKTHIPKPDGTSATGNGSDGSSGHVSSSQDCAQPSTSADKDKNCAATSDTSREASGSCSTGVQTSPISAPASEVPEGVANSSSGQEQPPQPDSARQGGCDNNGSNCNGQHETSTSESLRSMIVRLERLVQQQREQREQARQERERSSQDSQGPSQRPDVWELRDVSSSAWLHNYNNSGSDSDSSPESERQQPWDRLSAEERLSSSLQNEMYGANEQQNNSSPSGSRRCRSNQLDLDWEWTRESTRLRARQVLSLMVESLTQFFEENGLSHNTPHAVLDEQIYNLYVLLQLALELTDLLLAQLVSTRRELEHQWVHHLRGPVPLDGSLPSDHPNSNDRTRDREQRVRGRQFCGGMMYRRFRHRVGDPGSDRTDRDRSSDRGLNRGRGDCGRRLSSRMMNCFGRHHHEICPHSSNSNNSMNTNNNNNNNNYISGSNNNNNNRNVTSCNNNRGRGSSPAHSLLGMHSGRLLPNGRGSGLPWAFDRAPGPAPPVRRPAPNDSNSSPSAIMVRVQQYETRPTMTAAQDTHPTSTTNTTSNMSQQQRQQQQLQQRRQQLQRQQQPNQQSQQQSPRQPQQQPPRQPQQQSPRQPHQQPRLGQFQHQRLQHFHHHCIPLFHHQRLPFFHQRLPQPQQQQPQQQNSSQQQRHQCPPQPQEQQQRQLQVNQQQQQQRQQQRQQQQDSFTVPLVRVNDILIPDTAVLNHQPWTRPRSPPPRPNSPFRNPFALNVPHEHRMLGAWHELFPYGPGPGWRPRFLHPRYMGHNLFNEDQEDVYHGHPGENFNFIRDTVIITDAPMSPNHRIQVWDFSNLNIPDISNAEKNMIVPECRIHNDASVDVSRDGRLLVTLLPSGRLSITTKLGVYSLQWESLGQCLYTTSFDQSAVSVSLSPASRHLLVGLATRRVALLPNDRHTMAQIFRLEGARLGQGKDGRGRNNGARGRLCHLRDIEQGREQGYMSLNCIRWAPGPGQGFVYGTNTGQLKVLR